MPNEILRVLNPRRSQRSHFNIFEDCFSSWKVRTTFHHQFFVTKGDAYSAFNGNPIGAFEEMGAFEHVNPIESFLQNDFDIVPDIRTLDNFKYIVDSVINLSILDLIQEDDIYVEDNGAISLEIYKDDLKTFISIGKESFGYYIRKGEEILDKQNDVPLIFWGNNNSQTSKLKSNLALYYLNPTLSKHAFRLTYGI